MLKRDGMGDGPEGKIIDITKVAPIPAFCSRCVHVITQYGVWRHWWFNYLGLHLYTEYWSSCIIQVIETPCLALYCTCDLS